MSDHFNYHSPETWDEAKALLHQYGPEAKLLAGGTDLMILIERSRLAPRQIISLDRIPGWDSLTVNGAVTLGAGTTYRQLERTPALHVAYIALVNAARQVGGIQVRNVATVAGNLCNASPAADAVPPLLVMDAVLTLDGPNGVRAVPVHEFIAGPGRTILGEGELLRQIGIPALPGHTATVFLKAGRRRAMEISIVCVAVRLTLSATGNVCETANIALGAVAPTPIRAWQAEQLLQGQPITAEGVAEAAYLASQATSPISDVRASADYRKYLSGVMVRRALEQCFRQITGSAL
jgi:aerobic carbon-monoxide dehydrogenase medium subunit